MSAKGNKSHKRDNNSAATPKEPVASHWCKQRGCTLFLLSAAFLFASVFIYQVQNVEILLEHQFRTELYLTFAEGERDKQFQNINETLLRIGLSEESRFIHCQSISSTEHYTSQVAQNDGLALTAAHIDSWHINGSYGVAIRTQSITAQVSFWRKMLTLGLWACFVNWNEISDRLAQAYADLKDMPNADFATHETREQPDLLKIDQ